MLFDAGSRGRYSTDASIYQIEPVGVVVPKTDEDARRRFPRSRSTRACRCCRAAAARRSAARPSAKRSSSTSRKHLNQVVAFDKDARTVIVQPGIVLDQLNAYLKPHGLWYPVDVSTSAQATIGGMAGNNSCGSRSIRYGNMVHNVRAVDAVLADGSAIRFGAVPEDLSRLEGPAGYRELVRKIRAIAVREAEEIEHRYPESAAPRRRLQPRHDAARGLRTRASGVAAGRSLNMAHLLVGSEGTLAYSRAHRSSISRRCRSTRRSACATSRRSTRRWKRRSTS